MVFKVFFVISFQPCVPSYHPCPTGVTLLNCSTVPRDSATNIEKTSQNGAPERKRPNRSVVIIMKMKISSDLSYMKKFYKKL